MVTKKAKAATRKVKDRWKAKEWYKIYAPKMFNEMQIGETPSADPSSLIGRTTEVTVHDLTGDFSKMHIKLKFKINEVNGFDARTIFVGQDLTSDYVRRLTRRRRTKTDHVVDARTKDGYLVRIKPMSVTEKRIQSSQETAIRAIMTETIQKLAADMTMTDLVKAIISGDLAKELAKASKVVVPIKRMEIRRTEVLEMGTPLPEGAVTASSAVESTNPGGEGERSGEPQKTSATPMEEKIGDDVAGDHQETQAGVAQPGGASDS